MPWPVYINGKEAGELTEAREGLYRVFRADCAMREGLHRLWLKGEDGSAYLGLLTPRDGRLRLTVRFSRAAAAALPGRILCAADREKSQEAASPPPEAAPQPQEAPHWRPLPDGALTAFDGRFHYLALPAALPSSSPAAGRLRRIGGKDYLVFRRRA